jgi:hypothetical protein
MTTLANVTGKIPAIGVKDTAMLLIDHQSGLLQAIADLPSTTARKAPAKTCRIRRFAVIALKLRIIP